MSDKNFGKINIKIVINKQQCTPLRNFRQFEEIQIMAPNLPQKLERQKFWRNKHSNRKKHIALYPCTKFHLIWRTSDFGTNLPKNDFRLEH